MDGDQNGIPEVAQVSEPMLDGDRSFSGWNAQLSPETLGAGKLALSVNNRMRSGVVEPRGGIRKTGWWNPDNYPFQGASDQPWTGSLVQATGTVEAGGSYTDPETGMPMAVADRRKNWQIQRVSGPEFSAGLNPVINESGAEPSYYYVVWAGGLIQRIVARIDGNTLLVEDFQSCAVTPDPVEAFAITNIQMLGTFGGFASSPLIRAGFFSDPNGEEWDVRIINDRIWLARDGERPRSVPIGDGGVEVGDDVFLLQCFERLLLFRGEGKPVLEWDGGDEGFLGPVPDFIFGYGPDADRWYASPDGVVYEQPEAEDFTKPIPGAKHALFFGNRVWVPFAGDSIAVSDVGSYTRYDYLANEFRLNDGQSDGIVALHPFGRTGILVFLRRSIYLLENAFGDLSQLSNRRVSNHIGCGGAATICDVGDDIWWADLNGHIWAISQVDQDRMQLTGNPLSWPIHPDMAAQSCGDVHDWRAAYHNGYFYLATRKADGSGGPVYVFDTIIQDWVSRDMPEPRNSPYGLPQCLGWIKTKAYGEQHLLFQTAFHSCIYDSGDADNLEGHEFGIRQEIRTRSVSTLPLQDKRVIGSRMQLRTLNPRITAKLIGQGVGQEQRFLNEKTFNRQRYTVWGKGTFNLSNANRDYAAPHREDYSVRVSDGLILPEGEPLVINRFQEWRLTSSLRALGESFALEISNGASMPDDGIYSYPSTFNLPTGIRLASWRIDAVPTGHQQVSLT